MKKTEKILKSRAILNEFILKVGKQTLTEKFEKTKGFKNFEKLTKDAIFDQAIKVGTKKLINQILALFEKVSQDERSAIRKIVEKNWIKTSAFLSGDQVFDFLILSGNIGGQTSLDRLGIAGTFNLESKLFLKQFKTKSNLLLKGLDNSSIDDFTGVMAEGIDAGMTNIEMQEHLSIRYKNEISPFRAEMITRTEFNNTASDMLLETSKRNGVKKMEWITARDDRVSEMDRNNDRKVRAIGKKFPSGHTRPPSHPNCIIGDTKILPIGIKKIYRFRYKGNLINVKLADGSNISVTPNHMLLTRNGWKTANSISKGDNIINCSNIQRKILTNPNNNNVPITINQMFNSSFMSPKMINRVMPITSKDFHGDGMFGNSQVNIISINSKLWNRFNAFSLKHFFKLYFSRRYAKLSLLSSFSSFNSMLIRLATASDGIMGIKSVLAIFFPSSVFHHKSIGNKRISYYNIRFNKAKSNRFSGYSNILRNLINRYSGLITFNTVVDVKDFFHNDYVYDLETTSTVYISNNVLSSNCRCDLLAKVDLRSFKGKEKPWLG